MKHSESSKKQNWLWPTAGLSGTSTQIRLPSLKPQPFPKFPTFSELAGASVNEPVAKPKETGLFEGLMGGDPRALFQDLVSCPHKYQPGTDTLLQQMLSGQKTPDNLTPDERLLLDHATLEYTQPSRIPVEEEPIIPMPKKDDPANYLPELADDADDEPPTRGPMNAYWWL